MNMTDRNELAKLYGKRKEYLIGKQLPETERAKVEITPLALDDMELFNNSKEQTTAQQKEQTLLLLSKSLTVNIDDLRHVAVAYLEEIFDCVMDINNFKESDKIAKIKASLQKNE